MSDSSLPPPPVLSRCLTRLGIATDVPVNWELLDQALTHASVSTQNNNERLEFLGDAVLRLAAAEFLMERYPQATVGELSTLRAHLVSDQTLTNIAQKLDLENFLQVSAAAAGDLAARPTRLADAIEAILAVLYLSAGDLELVRPWLDPFLQERVKALVQNPVQHNPKTALQELMQKYYKVLPEYRTVEVSTVHGDPQRFRSEAWFRDRCLGSGKGASRKSAEQAAALDSYAMMQTLITADLDSGEIATPSSDSSPQGIAHQSSDSNA